MTERDQAVELTGNLKTLSHSARSLQSPPAFAHTTPDRGLRHYDTRFG
jgi:predicted component of type VI protein secretion system